MVNADNLTLTLTEILPIAGAYNTSNTSIGGSEWTRLKASDTSEAHEGVRLRIHGGRANGRKQHAVIDMLCIREPKRRDGSNEEVIRRTDDKIKRDEKDDDDEDGDDRRPGEEKKKQWEELLTTDDGAGGTIHFISYEREKAEGVLRLEWKTKYACEDAADDDDDGSPSGGWGIFSWFFFLFVPLHSFDFTDITQRFHGAADLSDSLLLLQLHTVWCARRGPPTSWRYTTGFAIYHSRFLPKDCADISRRRIQRRL